jgi:anti-anti-sigma regulatory factor
VTLFLANAVDDRLRIHMPQRLPLALVVLEGQLDLQSAGRLRQSLIKCLVDCPDAVVIDVAGLVVHGDLPLTVFRVIRRHAASWPAVPLVLAAPSPALADQLARTGLRDSLEVYGSRDEAIMKATGPPTIARADWDLVSGPSAPSEARALFTEVCRAWGVLGSLDAGLIVVSELVTNAVVHASGAIHVTAMLRRSRLHLVVRDSNPDPPRRVVPTRRHDAGVSLDLGGRGIPLLDAVCRSWGHLASDTGKAVWGIVDAVDPGTETEDLSVR